MSEYTDLPISNGVNYIAKGYIDYAEEVITERAIPDLYDGLKPVLRKLLWAFHEKGKKGHSLIKSTTISGDTLSYHPHNSDAIYNAGALLTDLNGFAQFPLIKGHGNLGNVSSGARPSAPRYTEMCLHENSDEVFRELDGIDFVPNFDATLQEPKVLPVSFPLVLVNPSEGIAVGFSSKIPSFNFNDVIDLTIEYLRDGECHTVITPDFTTRGYYIQNKKELLKLMKVGKANLKLRGKYMINDKEILVTEVPFGKTVESLKKQIEQKDFNGVSSVGNLSDYEHGTGLYVKCKSKGKVDETLYYLYKDTDLQYNYHANITVVQDGKPREIGVWQVIEEWVKWRRTVVTRDIECRIEECKQRMRESEAFMQLINKEDLKKEFVSIVTNKGRKPGQEFLRSNFSTEEIPDDLIKMVGSRPITDYHTGGKYAGDYEVAKAELEKMHHQVDNIDETLIAQLEQIKATYGASMQRHTEVTNTDYEFVKEDEEIPVDNSTVYYTLKDNFFRKLRYGTDEEVDYLIKGTASDTLLAFDNRGRILRIYASELGLNSPNEMGVYLPRYFELEEDDDYKILWMGRLDGSKKMLLYSDGNVSFLDTSEWLESGRQIRVIKNGISSQHADKVCLVFDEIPEILAVTDNDGKIGWVDTNNIKRKFRTARTKVFNLSKDSYLMGYLTTNMVDLSVLLNNMSNYEAPKVRYLVNDNDYRGTGEEFYSLV